VRRAGLSAAGAGGLLVLQAVDKFGSLPNREPLEFHANVIPSFGVEIDVPPFDDGEDGPTLAGGHGCITAFSTAVVAGLRIAQRICMAVQGILGFATQVTYLPL